MTRALLMTLVVLVAGAATTFAVTASGADDDRSSYTVVLDNAFGLTNGADLRASGVNVGKVTDLDIQRKTARALATIEIARPDFAGFRKDVFCEVKPQSLIGEYYLDCTPGKSSEPAPRVIPVEQTAGTIPPDLVLDILRRPARERFGLILSELGMGLTGRGDDLQATIRRGVPALRETDRVLRILAANRRTLQNLARDADRTLVDLAGNRRDVARFVREAGDTTAATADRKAELAETVRKLPGFLRELRPTLASLGTAAEQQTPALADLRRAAPDLTTLLRRLGPFAESARPAVRGLGEASDTGIEAVTEARSTVSRLRSLGASATEPMRNLRFVLEDLDDRSRAVEPNRLSPGNGAGFTGLEAFLQYAFVQSQAINVFDSRGYLLKLELLVNECTQYTNAQTAIEDAKRTADCKQWLGPNQPGINSGVVSRRAPAALKKQEREPKQQPAEAPAAAAPSQPAPPPPAAPERRPLLPDPKDLVDKVLPGVTDKLKDTLIPPPRKPSSAESDRNLLDYLLGP
ncbi:MAG TPA: MlaD family protein [Solirubrobacteraceae bacterium]|nr:MlaD family protein [Solirubrobacteraceae bacterium]